MTPPLVGSAAQIHSLQVGFQAFLRPAWCAPTALESYADTAALVASLDAVVTVQTSVAVLAGGLAVPTYMLTANHEDWRWGLGDSTPPGFRA